MKLQDDEIDERSREAGVERYRELLAEKAALSRQLAWLRSQLQVSESNGDSDANGTENLGSDMLFLADYACKERRIIVRGATCEESGDSPLVTLTVEQRMEKMSSVLWPSSCILAEVVARELSELCARGAAVLELGCGTAVPSIVAAKLGAQVLATDTDIVAAEAVMARNREVLSSSRGSLTMACLRWGDSVPEDRSWSAILVADAIYDEKCHAPLAATLASAVRQGADDPPRILLAYQRRKPLVEERFLGSTLRDVGLGSRELSLDVYEVRDELRSCIRVVDIVPLDGASSYPERQTEAALPDGLFL